MADIYYTSNDGQLGFISKCKKVIDLTHNDVRHMPMKQQFKSYPLSKKTGKICSKKTVLNSWER